MRGPCLLERLCCAACGILLSLPAGLSWGAEWSFEPSVGLRTEYNDNLELTPAPHPSVWGMILSPDVKFGAATETLAVTGGLNLSFNRYLHESQLNINNYDLSLHSSYKAERNAFRLNVDAVRDSTLVSELATTGVVVAYSPRNLFTVNPSWTRSITEATSMDASYMYTKVNYHDTAGTSLVDYQDQLASVALRSRLDERGTVSLTAYYDGYVTPPPQSKANTYGVQGGYDLAFSETLRGTVSVGWRWTHSTLSSQALVCDGPIIVGVCSGTETQTSSVQKEDTSGYTLKAILEQRLETGTLSGQLSREINPSGVGSLVQTDRLGATWTRRWSPTLTSAIDAAAYRSRYVGSLVTGSNSKYYAVSAQLSWGVAEGWVLDTGYAYARQAYDTAPVAANRNVVFVNVSYAWPKISVSR